MNDNIGVVIVRRDGKCPRERSVQRRQGFDPRLRLGRIVTPQPEGDTKRRMVDSFADLVSRGVEIVVLMALLRHGVGALRCIGTSSL